MFNYETTTEISCIITDGTLNLAEKNISKKEWWISLFIINVLLTAWKKYNI